MYMFPQFLLKVMGMKEAFPTYCMHVYGARVKSEERYGPESCPCMHVQQ